VPRPDALESRAVPSTLTVMNSLDHGAGSLRDTIAAAGSGDKIVVASSVHSITLTTGELEISKNLTINGPGASKLTISGNNASRVFEIDANTSVSIFGLTISNGAASGLLAVLASGSFSAGGGGGILNNPGASLTLSRDVVRDNQAVAVPGNTIVGGGLLNVGTASVRWCQFSNNQALGGSGSDNIGGSAGGAVDNFGGASLTVDRSTFSNNRADAAGGQYLGIGGAVENNAGLNGFSPPSCQVRRPQRSHIAASPRTSKPGGRGSLAMAGPCVPKDSAPSWI
jgi:hypothetical protein